MLGFVPVPSPEEIASTGNYSLVRNEVSPFCRPTKTFAIDGDGLSVDPFYGQVYHHGRDLPSALYGRTDKLPVYAGEHLRNFGFLRVPFRRIPRIIMRSRIEFDAFVSRIQSADPNLITLYRGQTKEHYIPRSAQARRLLFLDEKALEPSLLPSASRRRVCLEDIGTEWSGAVQTFIWMWNKKLKLEGNVSPTTQGRISSEMEATVAGYNLWAMLLSLAQHYGLPSAGLDLTEKPEVALYFALTEFAPDADNNGIMKTKRIEKRSKFPVVYILSCQRESVMDFKQYRPTGFPIGRPDRQNAFFFHTAWGLASNVAANRIWVAIYLDPEGNWGRLPDTATLFPFGDQDPFANFLARIGERWRTSDQFSQFIKYFYWAI